MSHAQFFCIDRSVFSPPRCVQIKLLVAAAEGPVRRGTTPLAVRFHDRWGKPPQA